MQWKSLHPRTCSSVLVCWQRMQCIAMIYPSMSSSVVCAVLPCSVVAGGGALAASCLSSNCARSSRNVFRSLRVVLRRFFWSRAARAVMCCSVTPSSRSFTANVSSALRCLRVRFGLVSVVVVVVFFRAMLLSFRLCCG